MLPPRRAEIRNGRTLFKVRPLPCRGLECCLLGPWISGRVRHREADSPVRLAGAEKQITTGLAVAIVRKCDAESTDFGHFTAVRQFCCASFREPADCASVDRWSRSAQWRGGERFTAERTNSCVAVQLVPAGDREHAQTRFRMVKTRRSRAEGSEGQVHILCRTGGRPSSPVR